MPESSVGRMIGSLASRIRYDGRRTTPELLSGWFCHVRLSGLPAGFGSVDRDDRTLRIVGSELGYESYEPAMGAVMVGPVNIFARRGEPVEVPTSR